MICPNCGSTIHDDALFCGLCGFRMQTRDSSNDPMSQYATQPYSDPYADPNLPPQQPTPKKKTWLVITVIVAVLAILAVVLLLVLSGGGDKKKGEEEEEEGYAATPQEVVEDYIEANFNDDRVGEYECKGLDYKEYQRAYFERYDYDEDDLVDSWLDEDRWGGDENLLEYYCDEYDLDYDKWESRLYKVNDINDFIDFEIDFWTAYRKEFNKEYECSYEIKSIEEEELSGSDLRDAEDRFDSWYEYYEDDYEDALLFDEDDVDAYYLVTFKVRYEYDGEKDTERYSILVVETSDGCFIIDTDWETEY